MPSMFVVAAFSDFYVFLLPTSIYVLYTSHYSCYVSVKAAPMSFALENKHKQSRENIEKTNNNLGTANKPWENKKTKEPKKKRTILRDSWLDTPPFLKTSPELFVLVLLFFLNVFGTP